MPPVNPPPQVDADAILQRSKQILAEAAAYTDKLFDKSQAYNNAIILAGFGGLFALLASTASILPRLILAITALLLGVSLLTYVGYIIYGMFVMSWAMFGTAKKQLLNTRTLQEQTGVDMTDTTHALSRLALNIKIWTVVWIVSVASGLGAGVLMLIFYFGPIIQSK